MLFRKGEGYVKGAHENPGFACAAKHFPGNGQDFRDAHLSNNVNYFDVEEWDKTYGLVYKTLIENDLDAIMAGHIMLPKYAKAINPELKDEDMMPATLSPEIMKGLLRDKLGFNGMVVTDASHMVGMTDRMKRKDMLPRTINAGCDMFLFFNDPEEDFATMLEAYQNGTPESPLRPSQKGKRSSGADTGGLRGSSWQSGTQGYAESHQPGQHYSGKI